MALSVKKRGMTNTGHDVAYDSVNEERFFFYTITSFL